MMKDAQAAEDAIRELQEALENAIDVARETKRELERCGYGRMAREVSSYTSGTLDAFANEDEDNYQAGSIGSLLGSLHRNDGK